MSSMIFVTPGVQASQSVVFELECYKQGIMMCQEFKDNRKLYIEKQIKEVMKKEAMRRRVYEARKARWREEDRKNDISFVTNK